MRLPSLTALKTFETAARLGGVTRAAEELNVTQSAVSRQIRLLEQELGVSLFRRVHRGVVLSAEGERLAATLHDAFNRIAEGVDRLQRDPWTLKIRVPPTFGVRWLWPRLRQFEAAHPKVTAEVSMLWACTDPGDGGFDLGVRLRPGAWPAENLTELFEERLAPVCSPAFIAGRKPPASGADFERFPLLHCANHHDWRLWSRNWSGGPFDCEHGETFDTLDFALRAAEAGRGVAVTDLAMAEDDIAAGRLQVLVPEAVSNGHVYYLVSPDPHTERPAVRLFRKWIVAQADETRAAGRGADRREAAEANAGAATADE